MSDYFILGLNHRTADVALREKLYFRDEEIPEALKNIIRLTSVDEVMILSTCNRVEIIGVCSRQEKLNHVLPHFLWKVKNVAPQILSHSLYYYRNSEAIEHIFRVASSLDSMVIGEPQILGQLKTAIRIAEENGTLGKEMQALMTVALRVAKKVRTTTRIAQNPVSVGFIAAELAKNILGDLQSRKVLVIGTGKMSSLALRYLAKQTGESGFLITNRTARHAEEVTREFGGTMVPFEHFREQLAEVDIILTSTASRDYLLHRQDIERAMVNRLDRPLFIIDIAVPRDVEPAAGLVPGVHLFDIDSLREVVTKNIKARECEASIAGEIVRKEVVKFKKESHLKIVKPLIISLRQAFQQIRDDELQRHARDLGRLEPRDREFVEHITQSLLNRLLHTPLCALKENILFNKELPPFKIVEQMFGLSPHDDFTCRPDEELDL